MAHHQGNAVIAGIDAGDDALRFRDRQPKPVHAGVDVDGGAAIPARAAAKHVPLGKLVEVTDDRLAVDRGIGVAGVLEEAVERVERHCRQRRSHHARLFESCDKEGLAAGRDQRLRHLFGAAAIGVGLDHGGAFGGNRGLLQPSPVGDDGVEIDGENTGRGCERRRLVRLGRQDCPRRAGV
jgi:hypothetical protein